MPAFTVETALGGSYSTFVERGILGRIGDYIPAKAGKLFVLTTRDVWSLHGKSLRTGMGERTFDTLFFSGGESNKRLAPLDGLAEQMLALGADRTSIVIAFGGGIVTDMGGFLAAIFMRGIPVLQVPTTLLAQVDAAVGGKTGVNLLGGKNLIGSFHSPLAVLIDPDVLCTLSNRDYRAGLFEIIKAGIIRDRALFDVFTERWVEVLAMDSAMVDRLIVDAVRIKAEVVSADERESDLRRILNFGHTIGHALESETEYHRFFHGEAVAWGMLAATRLAELLKLLSTGDALRISSTICRYGPLPRVSDLSVERLVARFNSDKKTMQGKVHFVLPVAIGQVVVKTGIDPRLIAQAMGDALRDHL